jgi:hypothetical protein
MLKDKIKKVLILKKTTQKYTRVTRANSSNQRPKWRDWDNPL